MIGKKSAGSLTLQERIEQIRKDAEAFIDARVAEERKLFPDLPDSVVKQGLTSGIGCECRQVMRVIEQDAKNV